jgi:hypothetical protein
MTHPIHAFIRLSPLSRWLGPCLTNLNSLNLRCVPSLIEIGRLVLEKKRFFFISVFLHSFAIISPWWRKSTSFDLDFNPLPPKVCTKSNYICPVDLEKKSKMWNVLKGQTSRLPIYQNWVRYTDSFPIKKSVFFPNLQVQNSQFNQPLKPSNISWIIFIVKNYMAQCLWQKQSQENPHHLPTFIKTYVFLQYFNFPNFVATMPILPISRDPAAVPNYAPTALDIQWTMSS